MPRKPLEQEARTFFEKLSQKETDVILSVLSDISSYVGANAVYVEKRLECCVAAVGGVFRGEKEDIDLAVISFPWFQIPEEDFYDHAQQYCEILIRDLNATGYRAESLGGRRTQPFRAYSHMFEINGTKVDIKFIPGLSIAEWEEKQEKFSQEKNYPYSILRRIQSLPFGEDSK
ncbi:hypothetical protein ACFL2V_16295 [Pseudomonadota bacterium]